MSTCFDFLYDASGGTIASYQVSDCSGNVSISAYSYIVILIKQTLMYMTHIIVIMNRQ